jgi:NADH-quinone oxidoreductase subunit M
MMNFPILSAITFTPLLLALIVLIIPKSKENLIRWLTTILSLIPLALAIYIYTVVQADPGKMQFMEEYSWIPAIDVYYRMGVDGLSAVMLVLTTLLSTLCYYYAIYTIKDRVKEFYFLFLILQLVPMYLLIGVWGGERRIYASIKFFLYTLAGSMAMLLAIIAVYLETGTFNILEAAAAQPFASNFVLSAVAFWAFFIAFAIKVPIFPFHTWLPDAHTEAPTTGSVILAGVLLKLGAYGLIRIVLPMFPKPFAYFSYNVPIIPILAVISIVYGALVCMAQWDLKRLIAYSSVSHMGYVTLGISAAAASLALPGAGEDAVTSAIIGLNGASLQLFTHGIITGGLFFLVGMIYDRAHTRQIKDFGGLGAKLPYYYGIVMVTGFASLGLPGLAGFWSEFFVFRGAFAIMPVYAAIGVLGIVFTAAYILWKIVQFIFLGDFDQEKWDRVTHNAELTDMQTFEKVTMWPLVILMVLIGLYPSLVVRLLNGVSTALFSSF